jgi:hypothetical protein
MQGNNRLLAASQALVSRQLMCSKLACSQPSSCNATALTQCHIKRCSYILCRVLCYTCMAVTVMLLGCTSRAYLSILHVAERKLKAAELLSQSRSIDV